MSKFTKLELYTAKGNNFHLNEDYLKPYKDDVIRFLADEDYMHSLKFAKKMMISQEIKANNVIEGINNDLSTIDEVIKSKSHLSDRERKRIINLYHGYQYILSNQTIDEAHLTELYSYLSDGLLDNHDKVFHDEFFYRTKPVFISKGVITDDDLYTGMGPDKIKSYMNKFFEYVNNNDSIETDIDVFIKSQIMHLYFVYVHPYLDVNGRSSRTVAMWYLLNHESYPYIIFNRAIAFAGRDYYANIVTSRHHGDLTLFLKFMLKHVLIELEKEYVVHNIDVNSNQKLNNEELQILEYILTMKGNLTAKDLASIYNQYNEKRKVSIIYIEKIIPLIEKGIILDKGNTKGMIERNMPNINISINPDIVSVDESKIKYLKLERYI